MLGLRWPDGVCDARRSVSTAVPMSLFERLQARGSTELPERRCGQEMQLARTEGLGDQTDARIQIYNCEYCSHEMRLTVWADDVSG
jgi:hypothetical protein